MLADGDTSGRFYGNVTARANGSTSLDGSRPGLPGASHANGTRKAFSVQNCSHNGDGALATAQLSSSYFGHDREEVTRILIQALFDMGYNAAADSVSRDSGFQLENPTVVAFRAAILSGSWGEAEKILAGAISSGANAAQGNGLVLAAGSDPNNMKFWLRQQKFLELLEQRETSRALAVLREELTPLYQDTSKLHFLSSLLMCRSTDDLMAKANWDGASGQSRRRLLSNLSRCISPSVMLPENRLAVLLEQVKKKQIDTCLYHTTASSPSLYSDHFCDRRNFPTEIALELSDLTGEIWQVQFSHDGTKLAASGSRENVIIWNTTTFTVLSALADHDGGVGNLAWSPDDSLIVTCSQDKHARLWEAKTGTLLKKLMRFDEPVSGCVWARDGNSFILGTLDKNRGLCSFKVGDEEMVDWAKKHRVQDLCGSPDGRWLVAVDDSRRIHVYNAATRELEFDVELKVRPTSVSISQDSRHLLVNKQDGEAQLIDLATRNSVQKFLGHTGGEYLIRGSFGGANESFVTSGSEDGNILIWHKNTGAAVERLLGHLPRCNAVSWNPADPGMLASCGDDGRVKIWTSEARAMELRSRRPKPSNGWRNSNVAA